MIEVKYIVGEQIKFIRPFTLGSNIGICIVGNIGYTLAYPILGTRCTHGALSFPI